MWQPSAKTLGNFNQNIFNIESVEEERDSIDLKVLRPSWRDRVTQITVEEISTARIKIMKQS